jgi:cytochrome c553
MSHTSCTSRVLPINASVPLHTLSYKDFWCAKAERSRGLGPVPTIAGRSPSFIARQLYDMQHGNRNGAWTPLMAAVVAQLGLEDLLMAATYLASLKP